VAKWRRAGAAASLHACPGWSTCCAAAITPSTPG
jgi:hypothetical protein